MVFTRSSLKNPDNTLFRIHKDIFDYLQILNHLHLIFRNNNNILYFNKLKLIHKLFILLNANFDLINEHHATLFQIIYRKSLEFIKGINSIFSKINIITITPINLQKLNKSINITKKQLKKYINKSEESLYLLIPFKLNQDVFKYILLFL